MTCEFQPLAWHPSLHWIASSTRASTAKVSRSWLLAHEPRCRCSRCGAKNLAVGTQEHQEAPHGAFLALTFRQISTAQDAPRAPGVAARATRPCRICADSSEPSSPARSMSRVSWSLKVLLETFVRVEVRPRVCVTFCLPSCPRAGADQMTSPGDHDGDQTSVIVIAIVTVVLITDPGVTINRIRS